MSQVCWQRGATPHRDRRLNGVELMHQLGAVAIRLKCLPLILMSATGETP